MDKLVFMPPARHQDGTPFFWDGRKNRRAETVESSSCVETDEAEIQSSAGQQKETTSDFSEEKEENKHKETETEPEPYATPTTNNKFGTKKFLALVAFAFLINIIFTTCLTILYQEKEDHGTLNWSSSTNYFKLQAEPSTPVITTAVNQLSTTAQFSTTEPATSTTAPHTAPDLTTTEPETLTTQSSASSENVTARNGTGCKSDEFRYSNNCYWTVVYSTPAITFSDAEKICKKRFSTPAYPENQKHYNLMEKEIRTKLPNRRSFVVIWLGIYQNAETGDVTLSNGKTLAPFLNWRKGKSARPKSCDNICMVVVRDVNDRWNSMLRVHSSSKQEGVLCQYKIS